MRLTTPHSETVKAAFLMLANLMDTYASDQIASQRWQSREKDKAACRAKADAYLSVARDIREMEFVEEVA